MLEVPDEPALRAVLARIEAPHVAFTEPDLDGALTAIAVGPNAWRSLSSLPLMR